MGDDEVDDGTFTEDKVTSQEEAFILDDALLPNCMNIFICMENFCFIDYFGFHFMLQ